MIFKNRNKNLFEVVVPIGTEGATEAGKDGLYDDCPFCQMMRAEIEAEADLRNSENDDESSK